MIGHYLKGASVATRQEMRAWIKEHCQRKPGKPIIHYEMLPPRDDGVKFCRVIAWFNDHEQQEALEFKLIYSEFIRETKLDFTI